MIIDGESILGVESYLTIILFVLFIDGFVSRET